jgi:hypothetical protein
MKKFLLLMILSIFICSSIQHKTLAIHEEDLKDITPVEIVQFLTGLNNGLSIFKTEHFSSCYTDDEEVVKDLIEILKLFKDIDAHKLPETLNEIAAKAKDAISIITNKSGNCAKFVEEIKGVLNKLKHMIQQGSYIDELLLHSFSNIKEIQSKLNEVSKALEDKNFESAGEKIGDLINFVFLINFSPRINQGRFLEESTASVGFLADVEPTKKRLTYPELNAQYEEFIKNRKFDWVWIKDIKNFLIGFNYGFEIFNNNNFRKCHKVDLPGVYKSIMNLYNYFKSTII